MDKTVEFARKLTLLLENHGMQQTKLAEIMHVDRTLISKYCTAKRLPSLKQVEKIGDIFGVSTDYLLSIEDKTIIKPKEKEIPVLGEVRAGQPTLIMEENIIGYEKVDENLSSKGDLFALKVKGDSMSPRFQEGDTVIVKRQPYAETGEVAVVLINGDEATIKVFKRNPNCIILQPLNSKYDNLVFTNDDIINKPVLILGVVIELRARKFY